MGHDELSLGADLADEVLARSDPAETGEWETIIRSEAPGVTVVASELSEEDAELALVARRYLLPLVEEVRRLRAQLGR